MKVLTLLLITFFYNTLLNATAIDERLTDIYFANGVGAVSYDMSYDQGEQQYDNYIDSRQNLERWIGKYDLAFNTGRGVVNDVFEAWLQYTDEHPAALFSWLAFKETMNRATGIGGGAIRLYEAVSN